MKSYKVLVPKPAAMDENGTTIGLYAADSVVTPAGEWQESIMETFVENGWAMEVKAVQPEESLTVTAEIAVDDAVEVEEEPAPAPKKRGRPKKNPDPEPEPE